MPSTLGTFRPPLVTSLGTSTGSGNIVRLSSDGELYEDASSGWRVIRGTGGGSSDAVSYSAQSLTVAQRAQARSNIAVWEDQRDRYHIVWQAQVTSTASTFGVTFTQTAAGGVGNDGFNSTSRFNSIPRLTLATGTTAGAPAGTRTSSAVTTRGSAANAGGFDFGFLFSLPSVGNGGGTALASSQCFIGLNANNSNLGGDPSALTNIIGVGWDSADSTLHVLTNDASGTATKTNLGERTISNLYRLVLTAAPNASAVRVRVVNESTGTTLYDADVTTDLPANTATLCIHAMIRTTTTTSVTLSLTRMAGVSGI